MQPVEPVAPRDQSHQRLGLLAAGELLDARHVDRKAGAGNVRQLLGKIMHYAARDFAGEAELITPQGISKCKS